MEYLKRLHAAYDDFLTDISRIMYDIVSLYINLLQVSFYCSICGILIHLFYNYSPVIRVDYSQFRDAGEMADMVIKEYHTMSSIRHVDFDAPVKSSSKTHTTPLGAEATKLLDLPA